MSSNFYTAGLNHVGSYQVSGKPYLSGSNMPGDTTSSLRFQFSSVSKSITVKSNFGHAIRVHFAPYTAGQHGYVKGADNNDNFTTIAANGSQTFDVKCRRFSSQALMHLLDLQMMMFRYSQNLRQFQRKECLVGCSG